MGTKSCGLSAEDAWDKDDWSLKIKGQLANPGLPGRGHQNNVCMCVHIYLRSGNVILWLRND